MVEETVTRVRREKMTGPNLRGPDNEVVVSETFVPAAESWRVDSITIELIGRKFEVTAHPKEAANALRDALDALFPKGAKP